MKNSIKQLKCIFCLFLVGMPVFGQGWNVDLVGTFSGVRDFASCTSILDSFAYVADVDSGIIILNIADPTNPQEVGYYHMAGNININALDAGENYLYIAEYYTGMIILDISIPQTPVEAGRFSTVGSLWNVDVIDRYAFLSLMGAGIQIVDVSNPASPVLVSSISTTAWAHCIKVFGDYAIVGEDGFRIYDISMIENPVELCFVHLQSQQHIDIDVEGDFAYCAKDCYGTTVYDITDIENPVLACTIPSRMGGQSLEVVKDRLYLADGNEGLRVINCQYPYNLVEIGHYLQGPWPRHVVVLRDTVYMAYGYDFHIFDTTPNLLIPDSQNDIQPTELYLHPPYPNPFNQRVALEYMLPAAANVHLAVYDITGREVATLVTGHLSLGEHSVVWDAEGMASGVYFVRLQARKFTQTRKILLVK